MPVTTELILARHGEAHCNVAGIVGGEATCTGLTDQGHAQVRRLATRLKQEHATAPITALYTSPRRRTVETAAHLADQLNLETRVEPALRGHDHGEADGQPWTAIKRRFGGRPQRYPDRPIAAGAETWNEFISRCRAALRGILDEHEGERVLIAAHGETIEASFALFLPLPLDDTELAGQITGHSCLTRWQRHRNTFGHDVWMLAGHNDTNHVRSPMEVTT
ncbi:hypothetical protein BJF85_18120 [Saccharomonospora sp. CUA-673]|uniref:histidine phosphatase family protein n=1 Tax=Saccharomonospora sp. CUA-673 TaxID=1904969 RepID=UPI0009659675|nr:histidine phosphatase family protein [Saccharomonospora sp. CUA-673]OLT46097.1 hypothetical protein BJF85_18120 [Saccharomonospora sp. CUA-673]